MNDQDQKLELTKEEKAALSIFELERLKKHLKWFDYQTRGGRWDGKTPDEIKADRDKILEDISATEKKISEFANSEES